MALSKMLRVIVGDRKRKSKKNQQEDLRSIGEKYGWDRRKVDVPKQIAKYLGEAVRNEIWQDVKREQQARKHILTYLLERQSFYKGGRIIQGSEDRFHKAETVRGNCGRYVAYHEETPDKIVAERESFDVACGDVFDRLILLMVRDGATQTKIGEELELTRGQVQRRLKKIEKALQGDSQPPANGQSEKRAERKRRR